MTTHDEWQQTFVDLLHLLGYEHLHVRRSIGKGRQWVTATNLVGWPDLFAWKSRRGPELAAIECKVPGDYPRQAQLDVLASLAAAGVRAVVAYPDDLDRLHAMLRGQAEPWPYQGRLRT